MHRLSRLLARKTFFFWERLGLHLTYVHYYEPVPDTRTLDNSLWSLSFDIPGLEMNEPSQISLLEELSVRYRSDWAKWSQPSAPRHGDFFLGNGYFDCVDAELLYSFIRKFKPRRFYEIGSGFSTLLAQHAIADNHKERAGLQCSHLVIDPFPADYLCAGKGIGLLPSKVQEVPLAAFETLEANDVLFIDSSHVLAIGSDVQFEYLEILPRLKPGVLVHCHDIFLPAEYPRDWVFAHRRFWNEQYLLQAFLAHNSKFEILWAGNFMHLKNPDLLAKFVPSYQQKPDQPKSFWFRRKM